MAYPEARRELSNLSHVFRAELAAALEVPLRAHLLAQPHDTYEAKKSLASWVNGQSHDLGLVIRCRKTGKPTLLTADLSEGANSPSRFRLDAVGDDGRKVRTATCRTIPDFYLMEATPRRESLSKWASQLSAPRSQRQR